MNITDTSTFIEKANGIYHGRYDYSRVSYGGKRSKVEIICSKHGSFWLTPEGHTSGKQARGCPMCSIDSWAMSKRKSQSDYLGDARRVHGDRYSYDRVVYLGKRCKVCVSCRIHGDFWQGAQKHLEGHGCPKCAFALQYTDKSFVDKADKVHLGRYDYSKSVFMGVENDIAIVCRKHGEFTQNAASHLAGCGCPRCNSSSGERAVEAILRYQGEPYEVQKKFANCLGLEDRSGRRRKLVFDFWLPERMVLIEYDGKHHFQAMPFGSVDSMGDFERQKVRDGIKDEYAASHGMTLIRIPFSVLQDSGFLGLSDYLLQRLGPKDMAKLL